MSSNGLEKILWALQGSYYNNRFNARPECCKSCRMIF